MKLCLVTGACGFCGSYMVELLVNEGYKVRTTDILGNDRAHNYELIKKLGVEFIEADLTSPETLKNVVKDVEYVFHTAAAFSYSACWDTLYKTNVMGTRNLCEALIKYGNVKKFILWSSESVYGLSRNEYMAISEGYYPNPTNMYGKSKLIQEYIVHEYVEDYNFPAIVIRSCPIYGPRNVYGLLQVWANYLKLPFIILPKSFPVSFPYVHVKDVCGAALYLARYERRSGTVFDVVDDQKYDVLDFFKLLCKFLNRKLTLIPVNYKTFIKLYKVTAFVFRILASFIPIPVFRYLKETIPYSTVNYKFSNKKLKKIGYKFLYPHIKDGLKETLDWLVENGFIKKKKNKSSNKNKLIGHHQKVLI